MRRLGSLVAIILATLSTLAPAQAQVASNGFYRADNVAFFERARLGDLDVTPIGVIRDERCADIRFCFRENVLLISVILHNEDIPYEVVLELGQPVQVRGGLLLLTNPGTRPVRNGAIPLDEYSLDLRFIPIVDLKDADGS